MSHTRHSSLAGLKTASFYQWLEELPEYNVSRVEDVDLVKIGQLVNSLTKQLFGHNNVADKAQKCVLSLKIVNNEREIVGAICVTDHPNIPSIPADAWVSWCYNIYGVEDVNNKNSMWTHLVVFNPQYAQKFLYPMVCTIFDRLPTIMYLFFVIPANCWDKIDWLKTYTTKILPIGFVDSSRVQTLHLAVRQSFVLNYKIRRAVEEDNDDLVPLIEKHSPLLKELYGDYYIAEIITRHPDAGRQLIVAEFRGIAVSVLSLNDAVNYDSLNESFELEPFYGLYKPTEQDRVHFCIHQHIGDAETPYRNSSILLDRDEINFDQISKISIKETVSLNKVMTKELIEEEIEEELQSGSYIDFEFSFLSLTQMGGSSIYTERSIEPTKSHGSLQTYSIEKTENSGSKEFEIDNDFIPESIKNVTKYFGEGNAFSLEIAAAADKHESSLFALLDASFECFPNKDYCVLTIPSSQTYFPLLKMFARVTPRPMSNYPHELYVLHRNTISSQVSVRSATKHDIPGIMNFASVLANPGNLLQKAIEVVQTPYSPCKLYLLLSGPHLPIGVAIIDQVYDLEYLKSCYEIETWADLKNERTENIGVIEYLIMSPNFKRHSSFFLRELHRKSDFNMLFYCMNRHDTMRHVRSRPMTTFLPFLMPILPKIRPTERESYEFARQLKHDGPFAMYLSTPRNTSMDRYEVNTRIVVIGSSLTAISFLHALLFSKNKQCHVVFNNVTLVSCHGLAFQKMPHAVRDLLLPKRSIINYQFMENINLRCYVNVVENVMTGINRKAKKVIINEKFSLNYDMLFLMCGTQFGHPVGVTGTQHRSEEYMENMFIINTEQDASNALVKLKQLTSEFKTTKYHVLVYGYNIEALCCISTLLEFGVPPSFIVFVEPFPPEGPDENNFVIPDSDIDAAIMSSILRQGVGIYSGYKLVEWKPDETRPKITKIKLESKLRFVEFDCLALFLYLEKRVSFKTFQAIHEAGLVFDGRLVIGPDCRTNDPNIYAAGSMTKYSRRYYADHMEHQYFNREEIGASLGKRIREMLLPFKESTSQDTPFILKCKKIGNKLVPVYKRPLMTYCRLPGHVYYLHVCKAGRPIPLETAMGDDDYGQALVTGDCKSLDRQGYFRLHLNPLNTVETITCLSKTDFNFKKLTYIWGKHEALLNKMLLRFEMVFITDLFQYFDQPWGSAIYHEDYPTFEKQMMKILTSPTDDDKDSLIIDLMQLVEDNPNKDLTGDMLKTIEARFKDSGYQSAIEDKLLYFIETHLNTFTMYAHPIVIEAILNGHDESPLFKLM